MGERNEAWWTEQRIGAGFFGLVASADTLLVLISLIKGNGIDLFFVPYHLGIGTAAIMLLWFTLRGHLPSSRAKMMYPALGGVLVGGIGLAAGFVVPMFDPNAGQAPLAGIFFMGPLGFAVGTGLGAVVGLFRTLNCPTRNSDSAE